MKLISISLSWHITFQTDIHRNSNTVHSLTSALLDNRCVKWLCKSELFVCLLEDSDVFWSSNKHFGWSTLMPSIKTSPSAIFFNSTLPLHTILWCFTFFSRGILKGHRWSHLVEFNYSYWVGLNQYIFIIIVQLGNPYRSWINSRVYSIQLVVGKRRLVELHFNVKILNYSQTEEGREPEEYFMEGFCLYFSLGIFLSFLSTSFLSSTRPFLCPSVLLEWCTSVHPATSLPLFPHLFSLLSVPSSLPTFFSLPQWL